MTVCEICRDSGMLQRIWRSHTTSNCRARVCTYCKGVGAPPAKFMTHSSVHCREKPRGWRAPSPRRSPDQHFATDSPPRTSWKASQGEKTVRVCGFFMNGLCNDRGCPDYHPPDVLPAHPDRRAMVGCRQPSPGRNSFNRGDNGGDWGRHSAPPPRRDAFSGGLHAIRAGEPDCSFNEERARRERPPSPRHNRPEPRLPDDYPHDSGLEWERDQEERTRRERPPSPRHNRSWEGERDQEERARRERPPPRHNREREVEQEDRVGREREWREREDRQREMQDERVRREREDRDRDRKRESGTHVHREGELGPGTKRKLLSSPRDVARGSTRQREESGEVATAGPRDRDGAVLQDTRASSCAAEGGQARQCGDLARQSMARTEDLSQSLRSPFHVALAPYRKPDLHFSRFPLLWEGSFKVACAGGGGGRGDTSGDAGASTLRSGGGQSSGDGLELPARALLVQSHDMDLMVWVENVFRSRAQWWVMREGAVGKGQEQVAPWSSKSPRRVLVCLVMTCAQGAQESSQPSDPFAYLADAQPAGGGGGMADCTSGSYLVDLPHTSARPDGEPGGGGMGVCEGARLKAAIVMRQCRGFSQASPGQDLLLPGLDLPLLVFWTE